MKNYRIGVDIGGTFTDIVLLDDDGNVISRKISSSVENYARAIVEGLESVFAEHGVAPREVAEIMHGTTVASNAILELAGARVGLVTSKGFRDVLELRNLRMPRLYDLTWEKPPPLVERYLRTVVDERVSAAGEVVRPLARDDAARAVRRLLDEGVEAIAVCLVNSYANPVHERVVAEVVRELAPDLPCCTSFDVLPEIKEYERTSTTVVNTYVLPIVERYLNTLRTGLDARDLRAPLLIMQSNGGLTPAAEAATKPVNIVESGPAAGVVGARAVARQSGLENVISFDMGGTTAKASLVERGEYTRTREYSVGGGIMTGSRLLTGGGYLLNVPAIDLAEVGAGGGSIVHIDTGGSMQVGPRSAGARPGPVCYGLGGTAPTVTDAGVALGHLNPSFLCAGELPINADASRRALEDTVARPLGLTLEHAAWGARQVAIANMIRAIRAVSSERGRDPRDYALFAFGGNGALFATGMAEELGMRTIVVPPAAGLFSAFGLLYAEIEHHYSRTVRRVLRDADPASIDAIYRDLEAQADAQLAADGFDTGHRACTRTAMLHYQGQIYELEVPVSTGRIDRAGLNALTESFGREHAHTYGHRAGAEEPVELVTAQVLGRGLGDRPRVPERLRLADRNAESGSRRAYFGRMHGWIDTPVVARAALGGGGEGPCIVEEYDSTCLVPPGVRATVDASGNLVLTRPDP
ncbi:MAG: hydantoinase/oxoprolinase family protein [Thiotrichales bacterium]|nr:hydantoinase/oxoprolinase family protein [Thiotrichales bacterium]